MGTGPHPARRPTLVQVAEVAGVSRATVSRVVNGVESVDPDIRGAVERAIADTGYVPNRAARSLVTGRTVTVGLVVSEPRRDPAGGPLVSTVYADPFFGRIVSGILGELGPRRVHPLLIHVDSVAARDELLARLRQGDVDGVALVSVWPDDPLPELLARSGAPAVLFTRPAASGAGQLRGRGAPAGRSAGRRSPPRAWLPAGGDHRRARSPAREPGPAGRLPGRPGRARAARCAQRGGQLHRHGRPGTRWPGCWPRCPTWTACLPPTT